MLDLAQFYALLPLPSRVTGALFQNIPLEMREQLKDVPCIPTQVLLNLFSHSCSLLFHFTANNVDVTIHLFLSVFFLFRVNS